MLKKLLVLAYVITTFMISSKAYPQSLNAITMLKNHPTIKSRHRFYVDADKAIRDYGIDCAWFGDAAQVTDPVFGFGNADNTGSGNYKFSATANRFLSELNAYLFVRNAVVAKRIIDSGKLSIDGVTYTDGVAFDHHLSENEQKLAGIYIAQHPEYSSATSEISAKLNTFADTYDRYANNLTTSPSLTTELSTVAMQTLLQKLRYLSTARKKLRKKYHNSNLKLDYRNIEHRIELADTLVLELRQVHGTPLKRSTVGVSKNIAGASNKYQSSGFYVVKGSRFVAKSSGNVTSLNFLTRINFLPTGTSTVTVVPPPITAAPYGSLVFNLRHYEIDETGVVIQDKYLGYGSLKNPILSDRSGVVCVLVNDTIALDNQGSFSYDLMLQK